MIGKISTYILISLLLVVTSIFLESEFLFEFLKNDIILVLVTLLAINTATYGFLVSRIDDISKSVKGEFFENSIKEVKKSLLAQVRLIGISIVLSVIADSQLIIDVCVCMKHILNFGFIIIFVIAMDILRDTGLSIFELRDPKNLG